MWNPVLRVRLGCVLLPKYGASAQKHGLEENQDKCVMARVLRARERLQLQVLFFRYMVCDGDRKDRRGSLVKGSLELSLALSSVHTFKRTKNNKPILPFLKSYLFSQSISNSSVYVGKILPRPGLQQ